MRHRGMSKAAIQGFLAGPLIANSLRIVMDDRAPDREMVAIAQYVLDYEVNSAEAFQTGSLVPDG